jgi:hypothetical protein
VKRPTKMPEICTCGAQLVENARFCHRCGRPTFEIEPVVEAAPVPEVQPANPPVRDRQSARALAASLPIGFRNPIAMRVAFLMSVAIMLIEMIPDVNLLSVLWWLGAGWGAVALYGRMTGSSLTVKAGARLGTITGILTFLSMTILIACSMLVAGKELFSEMVKQNPQISPVLDDPAQLAGVVLMLLAIIFMVVVGACAAGGALGARFGARSSKPA